MTGETPWAVSVRIVVGRINSQGKTHSECRLYGTASLDLTQYRRESQLNTSDALFPGSGLQKNTGQPVSTRHSHDHSMLAKQWG